MPTPTNRTPVRVARGTYSNLNSSVSDIQEGEICYATDQDKLYVKEVLVGKSLTLKRSMVRARGRIDRLVKHFSKVTIIVEERK